MSAHSCQSLRGLTGRAVRLAPHEAVVLPQVHDVEVPDSPRRSLATLAASLGTVAVISGRPAEFLARTLSIPGLMLIGVYGFEE